MGTSPRLKDAKWNKYSYINIQELIILEITTFHVQQSDGKELNK